MRKPGLVVLVLSYLAFISVGVPDTVLGVAWPSLQSEFQLPASAIGAILACGMSGSSYRASRLEALWRGWA